MKRAAAISMAALLSVGGATTVLANAAGAQTPDQSTTSTSVDTTTPTTEAPAISVTDFSITLAGLGDISLSVDPITREISNIVVTPLDGITVGDPIAVHNGVQLDFTLADGTVKSIVVEIEGHHGQVRIEIEDESEDEFDDDHGDDHGDGPPAIEDRGNSAEHRNDDHDRHGPDSTSPPTASPTTNDASAVGDADDQSGESEGQESESRSGRSGRSGSRD